jgi:hypothetical protein
MSSKLKCSIPVILLLLLCILTLFTQCSKDDDKGISQVTVFLKDAPGDYEAVNVEVLQVDIHSVSDGWVGVDVQDSIYDLLLLQDSAIALLGQATVPADRISQIRLILGDNNSVQVDSVVYPLQLSSQDETGLKLNVNQELQNGVTYTLVLDFEADESVLEQSPGVYRLKPVLKATFR